MSSIWSVWYPNNIVSKIRIGPSCLELEYGITHTIFFLRLLYQSLQSSELFVIGKLSFLHVCISNFAHLRHSFLLISLPISLKVLLFSLILCTQISLRILSLLCTSWKSYYNEANFVCKKCWRLWYRFFFCFSNLFVLDILQCH